MSRKIQLSEYDQIRLMLHLLAILDGTNARNPEVVRDAGRAIKAMFDLSDNARSEANRQHHERWNKLNAEGRVKELTNRLGIPSESKPDEPEAISPAPQKEDESKFILPTKRMRKALDRFADLTDDGQVDSLRQMWGSHETNQRLSRSSGPVGAICIRSGLATNDLAT